jgi:hypothetical protein
MLNSGVLDVAIGMIFVYLILSLVTSAANEVIELKLKNRASDLEKGIRELIEPGSKAGATGLVKQLYDHPLVKGLFEGTYESSGIKNKAAGITSFLRSTNLPSYIPARNFALAIMDLALRGNVKNPVPASGSTEKKNEPDPAAPLSTNPFSIEELRTALKNQSIIPENTRRALLALIDTGATDITKARESIEAWFNSSMDRVSGWYKKRSQIIVFVLGFIVAFAVNADSVMIAKRLVADRSLRDSLATAADEYAKANANDKAALSSVISPGANAKNANARCYPTPPSCSSDAQSPQCKLDKSLCDIEGLGLPIGWNYQDDPLRRWPGLNFDTVDGWLAQVYWHLLGWIITALAISLGAPFWFDLLNKFIVVRSTVKPKEKSPDEKPKG